MTQDELLKTFIEIKLHEDNDFLKIRETLTRIGIASPKNKTLFQSVHIFHKQGKFYLTHFKEMFALDGKETNFSDEDKSRRNTIAVLLQDWGLLTIVSPPEMLEPKAAMRQIKVLSFKDKANWKCEAKYPIGVFRIPGNSFKKD